MANNSTVSTAAAGSSLQPRVPPYSCKVQGTEDMATHLTSTEGKDWVNCRDRALQIMYNSTTEDIRDNLDRFIKNGDALGLWATFNQASNDLFIGKVLKSFHRETYMPPTDTISSYTARLHKAQKMLAGTTEAITDKQLRSQLIEGLPDQNIWSIAKMLLINQFPTFEGATQYLRGIESTLVKPPESSSASANVANNRDNQRGKGKGRGRGRGRGRGKGSSRGRGRNQTSTEYNPVSSNQCNWCLKEGHWQKDCRKYKKARDRAQKAIKNHSESEVGRGTILHIVPPSRACAY